MPNQPIHWTRELIEAADDMFSSPMDYRDYEDEKETRQLYVLFSTPPIPDEERNTNG